MKQRTLSRVKDQTSKLASGISGVSLVRLPSAKLLSLFFGIMTCADRRTGKLWRQNADIRVMQPRTLRSLFCGTLDA